MLSNNQLKDWTLEIQNEFEELKIMSNKPFSEEMLKMLNVEKRTRF